MALTISKLKMWKDPGYTRNCLEIPPAGSKKLPAPDYTSAADETLRPHKGSTLTELHLPLSFTQTFGMSYLYIEASDGAGSVSLFGWITSIDQRSTAAEGVTIRWDVDWWRSYSGDITWGSGIIRHCNDSAYKRPYRTRPRYFTCDDNDMIKLAVPYDTDKYHRTVVITATITENGTSQIKQFYYSLELSMVLSNDLTTVKNGGLSATTTYRGFIDEALTLMGYDFEIISVFISPVGPEDTYQTITGYGLCAIYNSLTYSFTPTVSVTIDGTPTNVTFITPTKAVPLIRKSITVSGTGITADDTKSLFVIDFNGNKIGEIPYGITIKDAYLTLDIGGNGGYLICTFTNSANGYVNYNNHHAYAANPALGCSFTIPLPSVPVTTNYWSSYVISGQRDYDVTNARIANDQKAVSGIESTLQSGISGGVVGASAGPIGAIGGMIGGLLAGGISTGVNYALGENFNDQLQDARDRLYSNQTNSLQLSGDSMQWIWRVFGSVSRYEGPYLVIMHSDSVSATEYANDIALNGYETNISASSVSSYITTGGPLQIINLNVKGNTPPQAKQYIKDKLSAGVYIVENNPSGVVP